MGNSFWPVAVVKNLSYQHNLTVPEPFGYAAYFAATHFELALLLHGILAEYKQERSFGAIGFVTKHCLVL
jgi:hypothetical protein